MFLLVVRFAVCDGGCLGTVVQSCVTGGSCSG